MLGDFLKVSKSLVTSSADCLDIVSKVDAFYNNAWYKMILLVTGAFFVIGVVIPLLLQWYRDKEWKKLERKIEKTAKELNEKIAKAEEDLSEKIAKAEKDLKEVKEWADKAKESEKKARASNFFNEALKLYDDKKYKEAVAKYTEAIRLDPEYADAYTNRGVAKARQGDYNGAIGDYNKAIALDPKDAVAYNNRGVSKIKEKDYDGAIADLNEAIRFDPEYAAAYNNRGVVKKVRKDYTGAIADYNKAIEIDPRYVNAYCGRIVVFQFSGEKDKARDDLKVLKKLKCDDYTKDNLPVLELIVDGKLDDARAMIADMKEKGIEVDDDFEKLLDTLK